MRAQLQSLPDLLRSTLVLDTPEFVKTNREREKRQRQNRRVPAYERGLRYERKAQRHLQELYPHKYVPGPWFSYECLSRRGIVNYAQPDGLLIDVREGLITIVEIKYNHCVDSYFQLVDKYLPIVRMCFGDANWRYAMLEMVNWFDRDVNYPCRVNMKKDVHKAVPNEVSVHIWQP